MLLQRYEHWAIGTLHELHLHTSSDHWRHRRHHAGHVWHGERHLLHLDVHLCGMLRLLRLSSARAWLRAACVCSSALLLCLLLLLLLAEWLSDG